MTYNMKVIKYDSKHSGTYTCEICGKRLGRFVITIDEKHGGNVLCKKCLIELSIMINTITKGE